MSTRSRYGAFYAGNGMRYAHRIAYELTFGPIPDGMVICHRCDVPLCVNPDHLFVGTQKDNLEDMCHKGRHYSKVCPERGPRGERNGMAKLTIEGVQLLRNRYQQGGVTFRMLAEEFGVKENQVSRIVRGLAWK